MRTPEPVPRSHGVSAEGVAPGDAVLDNQQLPEAAHVSVADLRSAQDSLRAERAEYLKVRRELEAALSRYESVVNTVKEVIFQTDAKGRWTFLNPSWAETFGYAVADSLCWSAFKHVHPDDQEHAAALFDSLIRKERDSFSEEIRFLTAAGESRWVQVFARPTHDASGAVSGTAGTLNDVTQRHVMLEALTSSNRELEKARALAVAASQAKSEFVATMSHEIRTPLHTLTGMADLLAGTTLTAEQQRMLQSVRAGAGILSCLVGDLLDLDGIEQQQVELTPAPFSPWTLVEDVTEFGAMRAPTKVDVTCAISPDLPRRLRGDAARIRQILLNLVSNATKFTERGEVIVSATFEPADEDAGVLRLRVKDTGIGIPPGEQSQLFARSFRASNSREIRGNGLGLHISRSLVERMGGSVQFASVAGHGTEFVVSIPCQIVERAVPAMPAGTRAPALIVSPSPATRAALAAHLEAAGYVAVQADCDSAAAAVPNHHIQVVLLDYRCALPPIDARVIGLIPRWSVPTGKWDASLQLPVRADQMLAALQPASVESAGAPRASRPHQAARASAVLLVDHDREALELTLRVLTGAGHLVDVAPSGASALARSARRRYDLIVLEPNLPDMSGLEVVRRIRKAESAALEECVPVVALTAEALPHVKAECLAAGMNAFLTKPCSGTCLTAAVEKWADLREAVLVADDSPDIQLLARHSLAKVGLRTAVAMSGSDVLRQMDRQPVVAAILDMKMPGMTGLQILRAIRSRPDGRQLPVIACSGVQRHADADTMRELGCLEYLVKPVTGEILSSALLSVLRSAGPSVGAQTACCRSAVDDIRDLVPGYVASRQRDLTHARDAAIDGRFDAIESIGHNLKGTGASYGFPDLSRLGADLQKAACERDRSLVEILLTQLERSLARHSVSQPIEGRAEGEEGRAAHA